MLFLITRAYAQAPVISTFSPTSGVVGTTVNISGNNFNTSASANTVYFGAAIANVVSASSTLLTVTVPSGSTAQAITVTANGLTAYSQQPFIVTFNGPPFTAASLNTKVDFQSGNNPYGVAIKDLDGDGKPDMVVVNSGANSVTFFKNNSQPGVPSFTPAVQKPVNNYSIGVAIDDLDGDGKPDVVVTNFNANTISIFKNTSTINQISFNDPITFSVGNNPYGVVIADFNGDGKPDIAITTEYSAPAYIAVFTNSTAQGGPISFLPAISFPALTNSRGISAVDVDLDGKPDIIVASQNGFVSVFKNNSAGNNINFAAKIDYTLPSGGGPESVAVIDLDGDHKPDIAVADNNTPGTISILRNNSSPGAVSFTPRQDFSTGQEPFSICTGDIDGDGKPDLAVTNQLDNSISVLINSSTPGNINFNGKINFVTGPDPRSAAMADVDGSGKPDLIVGNNNGSTVSVLLFNTKKLSSVITFPSPGTVNVDNNNILNTGATSTNTETPIIYTSSNTAVAYVDANGLIHVVAPGTTTITASQSGNDDYDPAIPVSEPVTIKQNQVLTFPAFTTKVTCSVDFNANVTSTNPAIPITYTSSNPAVATINAQGLIHITGPGSSAITASQDSDNTHNAALPVSQQLTVALPNKPVVTIAADHASVCQGMPVNLTATITNASPANINYQWQKNGVNTGPNSSTLSITTAAITDVFTCIVTQTDSCLLSGSSNSLTNINFLPYQTPSVVITSSAQNPVCSGTAIGFTAVAANGGTSPTYQWKVNGAPAGDNLPTFTSTALKDADKVACDITNNTGICLVIASATSNTISASIIPPVNPAPTVLITASANNVDAGTPVTFTAAPSNPAAVIKYQWQVNGISAGSNSDMFTSSQLQTNDEVTCTIATNDPCGVPVTSAPIKMKVLLLNVTIPNTFSPNGDGVNDLWKIPALVNYPNCSVKIFNRYGQMVFDVKGYGKPWDGTYQGKALPVSTYYYMINLGDSTPPFSGSITIIR